MELVDITRTSKANIYTRFAIFRIKLVLLCVFMSFHSYANGKTSFKDITILQNSYYGNCNFVTSYSNDESVIEVAYYVSPDIINKAALEIMGILNDSSSILLVTKEFGNGILFYFLRPIAWLVNEGKILCM